MTHDLANRTVSIIPVTGLPVIRVNADLPTIISEHLKMQGPRMESGDILVVTHSIVSVAEGSIYASDDLQPTDRARMIAECNNQDPSRVEVALREAVEILEESPVLLTRTRHGLRTDYSGVDESNAPEGYLVALPLDSDASAERISREVSKAMGFRVPVIITDTQGRPWRRGAVNLAIGVSGMLPVVDNAGQEDIHGRLLRSSSVCLADEIASAAELVMGQANEGIPVAIVRGVEFQPGDGAASEILRNPRENLFL